MPLMVDLRGAVLSGTAQRVAAVEPAGAFVEAAYLLNASGAQAVTNVKVFSRPYDGGPKTQVGSTVASVAAGGAARIDVQRSVERLEVEADQGAGGNTVDIQVTGRVAD
jgi:hypothetical protein